MPTGLNWNDASAIASGTLANARLSGVNLNDASALSSGTVAEARMATTQSALWTFSAGISANSNIAAGVTFTPGNWMTNSFIGIISNVASRSIIYVDFVIHGSNSLLGFVVSNSWNAAAAVYTTNSVYSASTNRVQGVMKFDCEPSEVIVISNIITTTGSSYWYNARGKTR